MANPEWEAMQAALADAREERLDKGAPRSVWLGMGAWVLAPCCVSSAATRDESQFAGKSHAYRLSFMSVELAFVFFPAVLAATGLCLAIQHLRSRRKRRVEAWLGVIFTAPYLLLFGGGVAIGLVRPDLIAQLRKAPPAPASAPLTQAEVREFADRVVAAIASGDLGLLDDRLDLDALIARGRPKGDVHPEMRRGVENAARKQGGLLGPVIAQGLRGGSYELVRAEATPEPVLIFRLLPAGGGLNYHVLELCRGADGHPSIADLYVPMLGYRLSSTYEDVGPAAIVRSKSAQAMAELLQAGRHEEALAHYASLPEDQRRHYQLLALRWTAAQHSDDPTVVDAALDDMERYLVPTHPGVSLAFLDRDLERGQFERCLETIVIMERLVGADPYLDVLRAHVHSQRGDRSEALAWARRACDGAPMHETPWVTLGTVAAATGDATGLREAMERLVERFGYDVEEIEAHFDQAALRASPTEAAAWEAWKQERAGSPR